MDLQSLFGKRPGFRARVAAHREALYRLAFAWCHDAALSDDLVQEALLRALAHRAQLRDPERLKSWLCSILANALRDHYRRLRPNDDIDTLADELADPALTPEQAGAQAELAARVRKAIARLPLGQRQVLTLVDLEGLSYAEVGEALAVPLGTVMSRLCRARQALRAPLLAYAPETETVQLRRVK